MTSVVTAAILLLSSTGAWTVVLAIGSHPWRPVAVVLMAVSLWVATVSSLAGMMVARSRWGRRLGLAVTAAHAAMAVIAGIETWWWAAALLSMATAVALAGPWLNGYVRSLPATAGPPSRAVLVPLLLVGTPFLIGAVDGDGIADAVVGGAALVAAFWFIRTLPAALVVVRFGWPLVALAGAWSMGWPSGFVASGIAIAVSAVALHPSVTRAVVPLVQQGSVVPIPPELTPTEVLDAADIDDKGRRR
jgi:hypothetical protein